MPLGTQSDGQMTVANLHDAGLSGQNMPMEYHVQQQLVPSNNARAHYDGSGSQIAINNPSVLGTPSEEMVERIQALPILSHPILSDLIAERCHRRTRRTRRFARSVYACA
jgi:hypothetical protein